MGGSKSKHFATVSNWIVAMRYPILLAFAAAAYMVGYAGHEALPGNNPTYPRGWWGWFDQGEYLTAATAIRHFDWNSALHNYPPFYPLLGVPFVDVLPMHAFLPINLLCYLLFIYFFVDFSRKYITWPGAVCALLLSFYVREAGGWSPDIALLNLWLEPWTTTPVATIISYLIWSLDKTFSRQLYPSPGKLAIWGCAGGIVAATRPMEAVVLLPFYLMVLGYLALTRGDAGKIVTSRSRLGSSAVLIFSGIFWVLLFLLFNLLVHGTLGGRYFAANAQGNGFHFGDIVEKYISIFIDAGELYGVPDEAIYRRMLWMALSVPAIIYVALKGNRTFRLVAFMMLLQILLYLPYSDLLPTGIWTYHNIHYFKWLFPYAALFIFWMIKSGVQKEISERKRDWAFVFSVIISLPILFVRTELVEDRDVQAITSDHDGVPQVELAANSPVEMELVTLPVLSGDYGKVYFGGENQVVADGKPLKFIRDYRLFFRKSGGVQLLFIKPIVARSVSIHAKELSLRPTDEQTRVFRARLALGWPIWARR